MKKPVTAIMILSLLVNLAPALFADVEGGCVKQYCACDNTLHDCDFSEADCAAICNGNQPNSYYQDSDVSSHYREHDPNMDIFLVSFAVTAIVLGVLLYFSGALNVQDSTSPAHSPGM